MEQPKISIVVPIYNVEKYLKKCVNCLINQTFTCIEIILVNDGSTDGSGEICNEYALLDKRVKVIHKSNGGLSDARNQGTMLASGDYIMYLDSDDWIDLETCFKAYQVALEDNLDIVFWSAIYEYPSKSVEFNSIFIEDTLFTDSLLEKLKLRICGLSSNEIINPISTDYFASAWGKLYKTSIIKDNNIEFVDTEIIGSEDVLFNFTIFQHSKKIKFLKAYFNHYRRDNPNSLTKNQKMLATRFSNLFNYLAKEIKRFDLGTDYSNALQNRIGLSVINISLSISSKSNKVSSLNKIREINKVLCTPVYYEAIKQLEIRKMPIYWIVFFCFCKFKMGVFVFFMTRLAMIVRKLLSY